MDDFNYVCFLCILDLLHLFVKFKYVPINYSFSSVIEMTFVKCNITRQNQNMD